VLVVIAVVNNLYIMFVLGEERTNGWHK